MVVNMGNEADKYEEVFQHLIDADKQLWEAVKAIEDSGIEHLELLIPNLMKFRGDLHVDFMRPIYKKYPHLAEDAGFGDD